jgi:hypothetical protein
MKGRFMLAVIASFLFLPALLMAHHSAAAYESSKQITVTGMVTEFHFVNPHVLIYMTAKDDSGTTRKWQGELTSPNRLVRVGWNKDIMKTGDPIALTGYPAKGWKFHSHHKGGVEGATAGQRSRIAETE